MSSNSQQQQHIADQISIWPTKPMLRGVLSGVVRFDLLKNQVYLPAPPTSAPTETVGPEPMSASLDVIGAQKFQCAIIYQDQPGTLQVDDEKQKITLKAGVNVVVMDIFRELRIDSYMPRDLFVVLCISKTPVTKYSNKDFLFRRAMSFSDAAPSFITAPLRPVDVEFGKDPNLGGTPAQLRIFPNTFYSSNEDGPFVGMLGKKYITVYNSEATVALVVRIQGRRWDLNNFHDLDQVTGPVGTIVEPGETAEFEVADLYSMIRVMKRTIGGTPASGFYIDMIGEYEDSG